MKQRILAVLLVLLLAGCSKDPMTYEQARERFTVGMSLDQAKRAFGEPTGADQDGRTVYWTYVPEKKIAKGPKGDYSGFTVVFEDGKSKELLKHDIVKH
jgi:hypothetical protein